MGTDTTIPKSQPLLEWSLSLNTGFATVSMVFGASLAAAMPFIHLEVALNHLLHIRQTDYIRGYFAIWIPSLAIAICVFLLFRFFRGLSITKKILRSVAAMTIFLAPCAFWTCAYEHNGWSLDWPYKPIWCEAAVAVICVWAFLKARWEIGKWIGPIILVAHVHFWYFFHGNGLNGLNWGISHYGGPGGLLLNSAAALVWVLYIRELRQGHPVY